MENLYLYSVNQQYFITSLLLLASMITFPVASLCFCSQLQNYANRNLFTNRRYTHFLLF